MRIQKKDPTKWTRHFAWLPIEIGDKIVWLESYYKKFKPHNICYDRFITTIRYSVNSSWWHYYGVWEFELHDRVA